MRSGARGGRIGGAPSLGAGAAGARWCEGRYAAALGGMRWPFGGIRCCAFGAPHGRPSRRS
ncbi:hypothetical protein C7S17_0863 [Burkholderia thailandensis]|nr:hypothetical protein [Burkholderia thailandensis]